MTERTFDRLALLTFVLIGAVSFIGLRSFPIFVDEAINLWWLYRITDFGEWLRPLGDGKPLEVWPVLPLIWLGCDALTCMRALHVVAGIASTILVYSLASQFTSRAIAFIGALLTATCPWIVFFQRMAIADTYLCAAGLLVLYATTRLIRGPDWHSVILLGVSLPLAAMAKLPVGFIFLAVFPMALACVPSTERTRLLKEKRKLMLAYVPVLFLLCIVVAVALLQVRRGEAPGFGLRLVLEKAQAPDRFALLASNLRQLADEFLAPLTPLLVIIMIIGVLVSLGWGRWPQRWLTIWSVTSIGLIVSVASFWGSRYFLFAVPPLIIGAVCGWHLVLNRLSGRIKSFAVLALLLPCLVYMTYQSGLRIFDPLSARWSARDWGYITDWSSGYGYPELAQYLQSAPDAPPVIYTLEVGTAMQLRAYLPPEWASRVQQLQIVNGRHHSPEEARAYLLTRGHAWLVTPSAVEPGDQFAAAHLRRIAGFPKPGSTIEVTLYEVIP